MRRLASLGGAATPRWRNVRSALTATRRASRTASCAMRTIWALMAMTSSFASSVRRRRLAPMERAWRRTSRVRSRALDARGQAACLETLDGLGHLGHALGQEARVRRIGDVGGNDGGVGAHPVGLRAPWPPRPWPAAPRSSHRRPTEPQRVVIFISVVGCGTATPRGIRQKRCQEMESATSRHSGSKPSR